MAWPGSPHSIGFRCSFDDPPVGRSRGTRPLSCPSPSPAVGTCRTPAGAQRRPGAADQPRCKAARRRRNRRMVAARRRLVEHCLSAPQRRAPWRRQTHPSAGRTCRRHQGRHGRRGVPLSLTVTRPAPPGRRTAPPVAVLRSGRGGPLAASDTERGRSCCTQPQKSRRAAKSGGVVGLRRSCPRAMLSATMLASYRPTRIKGEWQ